MRKKKVLITITLKRINNLEVFNRKSSTRTMQVCSNLIFN